MPIVYLKGEVWKQEIDMSEGILTKHFWQWDVLNWLK